MLNTLQTPINRADNKAFEELARFLYPFDCEKAVSHLMRSTPRRVRSIFTIQAPAHAGAMAAMRKLADDLERLDRELTDDIQGALIVAAAGIAPTEILRATVHTMGAVRNAYPFADLMPGDWFWIPGRLAGFRNVSLMCQRQNTLAGRRLFSYQHLKGGTRVDRLP